MTRPGRAASAWLVGVALAGCATADYAQLMADAARVQITADPERARGCAFLGVARDSSDAELQKKAAWLGGDVALLTKESQEAKAASAWYASVTATAEVFRCEGVQ